MSDISKSDKDLISCSRCGAAGFLDCGDGEDEVCPVCDGEGVINQGAIADLKAEVERLREVVRDKVTEKHIIANNAVIGTGELKKEIDSLTKELERLKEGGIIHALDTRIAELEAENAELKEDRDSWKKIAEQLQDKWRGLEAQLDESEKSKATKGNEKLYGGFPSGEL